MTDKGYLVLWNFHSVSLQAFIIVIATVPQRHRNTETHCLLPIAFTFPCTPTHARTIAHTHTHPPYCSKHWTKVCLCVAFVYYHFYSPHFSCRKWKCFQIIPKIQKRTCIYNYSESTEWMNEINEKLQLQRFFSLLWLAMLLRAKFRLIFSKRNETKIVANINYNHML